MSTCLRIQALKASLVFPSPSSVSYHRGRRELHGPPGLRYRECGSAAHLHRRLRNRAQVGQCQGAGLQALLSQVSFEHFPLFLFLS